MPRRTKKIDNVRWTFAGGSVGGLSSGTQGFAFLSVATAPSTLLRMRGELLGYLDGTQAPGSLVRLNWGIIKVPEGSGTTVQYDPAADNAAPWIAYGVMLIGYEEYVTDVVENGVTAGQRTTLDGKAMRRIRPDEEVQLVVTNTTLLSASAVNFAYGVRVLLGD